MYGVLKVYTHWLGWSGHIDNPHILTCVSQNRFRRRTSDRLHKAFPDTYVHYSLHECLYINSGYWFCWVWWTGKVMNAQTALEQNQMAPCTGRFQKMSFALWRGGQVMVWAWDVDAPHVFPVSLHEQKNVEGVWISEVMVKKKRDNCSFRRTQQYQLIHTCNFCTLHLTTTTTTALFWSQSRALRTLWISCQSLRQETDNQRVVWLALPGPGVKSVGGGGWLEGAEG